ncbi:MAG TPA: right-handed parallel beta-helix repeat-containing protein [Kiritimatiellia bacterium]|jgi:hypothetical protein|nr:right-handed parallel beta-helix repeat-containing protein [Kiritimatiellia bacterium]HOM58625.1 right-handed parallel beta-helix repeat-containing protein [Kiritimatiellia bacterium]HOR98121.1 right-handed parallel beta-helix repeat-containing protein [Kiritimatiellia bacterium]HPW75984.1 right-handed parallel beta-helix repeat-containing protein [Kiritimatiellia bacterium]HRU18912.1 right-handed parallel beta-helix repeat-containing protein [Kiritimatiellia bacterium]
MSVLLAAALAMTLEPRTYAPEEIKVEKGGTPDAPLVIKAAERGKSVISGAIAPKGWQTWRGEILVADLPLDPGAGELCLYQDGERMDNARWPNEGYAQIDDCLGENTRATHDGGGKAWLDGIAVFDSPRLAAWAKEPEPKVFGLWFYLWAEQRSRLLAVDPQKKTFTVEMIGEAKKWGMRPKANFFVYNMLSEIDRPGEWAIERKAGKVYFWPKKDVQKFPPVFAGGKTLVLKNLGNVVFDGLVFEYFTDSAVALDRTDNVEIRSCLFRHTGGWAIWSANASKTRVVGCDMYDLGEGGVLLDGGDRMKLEKGDNVVDNCHIHDYGKLRPNYRPAVQLNGCGNRASHNLIYNGDHQALAFRGNDHLLEYNVIHDMCRFNYDAGCIYACTRDWSHRGTVIRHNLIYMTGMRPQTSATDAIYLDDWTSGVTCYGNIINRCTRGIHMGGGQDNHFYRNLIINADLSVCLYSRGADGGFSAKTANMGKDSFIYKRLTDHLDVYGSEKWKAAYPKMLDLLKHDPVDAHLQFDNVVTGNVFVACGSMLLPGAKARETCVTEPNETRTGDPGFADYGNFDWRIDGFEFEKMGLYDDPRRFSPAMKFGPNVYRPAPPFRGSRLDGKENSF